MQNATHYISLDIHDTASQAVVSVKKGDSKRKIVANFTEHGKPYPIDADCTATMRFKKPDGTVVYSTCSVGLSSVVCDLTTQATAAVGSVGCEITLYGADKKQITSPRFEMIVDDTLYSDSEVESSNEFTALTQAMAQFGGVSGATQRAESSAEAAAAAATAAAGSKTAAQEARTAAESAADTATAKATAAAGSATAANNSATSAAASAAAAESSAENAAASATDSATSATAATAAQSAAEEAAANATDACNGAQIFAATAADSKTAAENAATAAADSKTAAQEARTAAESAADTATAKATAAAASAASAIGTVQAVQESVIGLVPLLINNAGAHNATYRGKNLGTSVTAEQWAAIANGTFADLYIGDYWVIGGVNWRIAAFDYYYKTGDTSCTTHHAVIVPDTTLYTHVMNDTNTTYGGYVGSRMYTEGLTQAKTTISDAFGANHILTHRQALVNDVTNGKPIGGGWRDSTVELMSEQNVYGGKIFVVGNDGSSVPYLYTVDKSQFPLFAHDPSMISNRQWFWLRDVVSAANFTCVNDYGAANSYVASKAVGVRPAFAIM